MGKTDNENRFEDYLSEQLKDTAFKAEYDALEPKFEEIRSKIEREKALKDAAEKEAVPVPDGYVVELRREIDDAKEKIESGEKPVYDSISSLIDGLEGK